MKLTTCKICEATVPQVGNRPRLTCSDACRKKLSRLNVTLGIDKSVGSIVTSPAQGDLAGNYTAENIKVMPDADILENPAFDWKLAGDLSGQYRKPEEWIARGLKACRHAGVHPEYFIHRHLQKLPEAMNLEVDKAFREVFYRAGGFLQQ